MSSISEKIAYIIRAFEGNDKTAFARKIGTTGGGTGIVHDWIKGKAEPKKRYRAKICEAYADKGVDMGWLNNDNLSLEESIKLMGSSLSLGAVKRDQDLILLMNKRFNDIDEKIDRLDRILCGRMSSYEQNKKYDGESFVAFDGMV